MYSQIKKDDMYSQIKRSEKRGRVRCIGKIFPNLKISKIYLSENQELEDGLKKMRKKVKKRKMCL